MTREVSVEAPCGRVLYCVSVATDDQTIDDGVLIAAAPDLLEACRMALRVFEFSGKCSQKSITAKARKACREALEKAGDL